VAKMTCRPYFPYFSCKRFIFGSVLRENAGVCLEIQQNDLSLEPLNY
jgi:hypothetical protein